MVVFISYLIKSHRTSTNVLTAPIAERSRFASLLQSHSLSLGGELWFINKLIN